MNSGKTSRNVLIALLVLSLGVNAILLSNVFNSKKEIATKTELIADAEQLNAELEEQYQQSIADLDEMKSNNEELNSLIESQKGELTKQKRRISGLLKDSKNLSLAREEINNLMAQKDQYLAEITTLRDENSQLVMTNKGLSEEKATLSVTLEEEKTKSAELTSAQAVLMSEKNTLSTKNADLTAKVNRASVIDVDGINVTGWMVRNSGVTKEKKKAKQIDYLQICIDTEANVVAAKGSEVFYVRVITPLGETMSIDNLGSGTLTKGDEGSTVKYTKAAEIQYDQTKKNTCMDWNPGLEFQKGIYTVEVFNKGHLSGTSTFELK